ncbi:MAG TPA: hypothetical protein VFQ61_24410 [Polyangiaceae bacterium]|nr:hypothetical protein [Polyangiaceae bacterium]
MATRSKTEMLNTLRTLIQQSLQELHRGAAHSRLTRVSGAVDGYMRALLDAGIAKQDELLAIVASERALQDGPATAFVQPETASAEASLPSKSATLAA